MTTLVAGASAAAMLAIVLAVLVRRRRRMRWIEERRYGNCHSDPRVPD